MFITRLVKSKSIFLFLLLLSPMVAANGSIVLTSDIDRLPLGLHAVIYKDDSGNLTIDNILNNPKTITWTKNPKQIPNFAFSHSVYWIRLDFESGSRTEYNWWLELAFPLQDYIDYYLVENGQIKRHVKTGDQRPFDTRPFEYRNFLFDLPMQPDSKKQVYFRLATHDGLHERIPLILWNRDAFSFANGFRNLGLGIYFGILIVIASYNLFIFLSVRDKAYFYYVLYIAAFNLWLFSYFGFSFQFFWPESPQWANQAINISAIAWAVFMLQFMRLFLHAKQYAPWFDKLSKYMIGGLLITAIVALQGIYSWGVMSIVLIGIPGCICAIVAGYFTLRSGYRPAAYFLLAWTTLLLSLVLFCLKIAGLVPSSWFVERSLQIGSVFEVVLLSLGLADRINVLKREKIEAQEEALNSYKSSLKLKNDFITAITHELRTPMNAIMGGLQVLDTKELNDPQSALSMVNSGASEMMHIVDDILIHTEIQSDNLQVNKENIELHTLAQQVFNDHKPLGDQKGLELKLYINPELPPLIKSDKSKLEIILSKLLANALKFTETGSVSFFIEPTDNNQKIQFRVTDTGPGISAEDQEKVFEAFMQKETGFTRRYSGFGIGLSICDRLAHALGGDLSVESENMQGSTFTLSLPLKEGERNNTPPLCASRPLSLPVLVVEDNKVNQIVIVKMLEKLGYHTLIANHGGEAIQVLDHNDVSLILMDLQMPVMDGFTCTKAIRERSDEKRDLPIIAVSANLMDFDKQRCLDVGMNTFIEKPVKLTLLKNTLATFISQDIDNNDTKASLTNT